MASVDFPSYVGAASMVFLAGLSISQAGGACRSILADHRTFCFCFIRSGFGSSFWVTRPRLVSDESRCGQFRFQFCGRGFSGLAIASLFSEESLAVQENVETHSSPRLALANAIARFRCASG